MHNLSKNILEKYQVRKTRKQKTEFINYLQTHIDHYPINIEESGLFKSRNIVVGDLEKAKYVFTAHYDTQPVMPFPNFLTPMNFVVFVLFNTLVMVPMAAMEAVLLIVIYGLLNLDFLPFSLINMIYWFSMVYYMLFGKANKHTANDNTSGVITLIEIVMSSICDDVCCVFFDHEEIGMVGSNQFLKKHKELLKDKIIINYDCVSDGKHMLFVYKNIHETLIDLINEYPTNYEMKAVKHKKAIFPSDHTKFQKNIGIGAFHQNKYVGYYLGRIHTAKDTVFEEENIELLKDFSLQLLKKDRQ